VLRQTAAALAAAHAAGVVHRDVKPGNLLVAADGRVTVTDFGIAWSAASLPLTQTGQVVGTAHYLSPEQAEGRKAGPASDVYALGVIAYECLAGRRAFDGDNAVQLALKHIRDAPDPLPDDVPDAVRSLVGRMLRKDPAARFADGAAVRAAVDDVLAGRDVPAAELGDEGTRPLAVWSDEARVAPPPAPRRPLRSRILGPAVALLAGAGIAVAAISVLAPPTPVPQAAATTDESELDPSSVVVAADLVGRPVDDVESELAGIGLRVERVAEQTARAEAGTVLAVTPSGALTQGDLVRVTYAVAATAPAPASTSAAATVAVRVEEPAGTAGQGGGGSPAGSAGSSDGTVGGHGKGPGQGNGKGTGNGSGNGKGGHGNGGGKKG
jgi:eukaryotic-like serine/threonine-protein kinase